MLTCYALTGDTMFRDKARHVADKLLPAFQTPTGIPHSLINPSTGVSVSFLELLTYSISIRMNEYNMILIMLDK